MKLQDMIDAAFGAPAAPHSEQQQTEQSQERTRVFAEQAKKVEVLRSQRLAATPAAIATPFVFEVVRYRGHWRTLHNNKRSAPYPDQVAAILAAKKLAVAKREGGHAVEVILRRTDGQSVIQPLEG